MTDHASGVRLPDCSTLAMNRKNDVTCDRHNIIVRFILASFVSVVKFSYCSKFHLNTILGSGVMTIFFYKGLTRNPEIGNRPVWVFPYIWRLGQIKVTKFGTNVSNKILLNAANAFKYDFFIHLTTTGFFRV